MHYVDEGRVEGGKREVGGGRGLSASERRDITGHQIM